MKRALPLVLVVLLGANCASRTTSQANRNAVQDAQANAQPTTESATPATAESDEAASTEKEAAVPPEFSGVDFKNFTYPASFEKGRIPLKDGLYEYPRPEGGGGDDFEFSGVDFVDLTGDGKKEAVVQIFRLSCGGSCDGGSHLLYVYTSRKNRPKLFWRIESGSLGYECGLKSLDINGRAITLELFKNCRFRGAVPRSTPTDGEIGKFSATAYTRFQFEASDRKVALKKREVFPYTQDDVRNDGGEISIRDEH